MEIFSYILTYDSGFAPNPFHGYCTLACCKPIIRRIAQIGDWIVGISPKRLGNRLVYAMRITDKITFSDYWNQFIYQMKKPNMDSSDVNCHKGDNCYEDLGGGELRQVTCVHSCQDIARDLSGKYVLISSDFIYYGINSINIPSSLEGLITGRGHKRINNADYLLNFELFVDSLPRGVLGSPRG